MTLHLATPNGNAPLLSTFETCYLMRLLSVGFLRDQTAQEVERVPACLLSCFPHEWCLMHGAPGGGGSVTTARWQYAGRFERPPRPDEVETMLGEAMTRARNEEFKP